MTTSRRGASWNCRHSYLVNRTAAPGSGCTSPVCTLIKQGCAVAGSAVMSTACTVLFGGLEGGSLSDGAESPCMAYVPISLMCTRRPDVHGWPVFDCVSLPSATVAVALVN